MKKIFITGGGGYVGTKLVNILLKKNIILRFMIYFFMETFYQKIKILKLYMAISEIQKVRKIF